MSWFIICIRSSYYCGDHIKDEEMDETCYTGRWGEKCPQNFGLETLGEEARSRKYRSITLSSCVYVCLFVLIMRQLKAVFQIFCDVINR